MYPDKTTIKSWAVADRPREKLLMNGRTSLSNAELLSIIIGKGCKNLTALDLAKQILSKSENSVYELSRLDVKQLQEFKGIGSAKAICIVAALELARRRRSDEMVQRALISSSKEAYEILYSQLADLGHEEFWIILLNRRNVVIRTELVSRGGLSATVVDPKIIFKKALEQSASSIILAHNHPSGNLKPSEEDIRITEKLIRAANNLDIKILDHLIFGMEAYYSFADEGRI